MDTFISIIKAISDPNRVRALMALRIGELCVCQIIALLKLAPSTVSKHMFILKNAGLVIGRKQEKWMYYALPDKPDPQIKNALQWIISSNEKDAVIENDLKTIESIKKNVFGMECCKYDRKD